MRLGKREVGDQAERLAERHLKSNGLKLVERNYSCRYGEIDLIMKTDESLVFIEVRYRSDTDRMSAAETIDLRKRNKITRTALHYLGSHSWASEIPCRFDVVAIRGPIKQAQLQWINNAFEA